MVFDPYKVLGVEKTTPFEDIKKRYKQLMKKYHPDSKGGNEEFSILISKAWEQIQKNPSPKPFRDRFPLWRHKTLFTVCKM